MDNLRSDVAAVLERRGEGPAAYHQGDESTLLVFRPRRGTGFDMAMTATSMVHEAIRHAGLRHVGTRDMADGRVAIEFADGGRRLGIGGMGHQNVPVTPAQLAAQGWLLAA